MKRIYFFTSIFFSLLVVSCSSRAQTKTNLSVEEFEKGIALPNMQLLDVRTQNEYNSGHIKNAFLANWTDQKEFGERVQYLDKNKPVYTYCLSGGRSGAATQWLLQNGFKEVFNLDGGMLMWKKNNKPVEGVPESKQISLQAFKQGLPKGTVLVDVGAVWCPPCKRMEPVINELKQDSSRYTVVNVDGGEQEELAKALGVDGFPMFIVFKDGKEVWRKQGVVKKEELLEALK